MIIRCLQHWTVWQVCQHRRSHYHWYKDGLQPEGLGVSIQLSSSKASWDSICLPRPELQRSLGLLSIWSCSGEKSVCQYLRFPRLPAATAPQRAGRTQHLSHLDLPFERGSSTGPSNPAEPDWGELLTQGCRLAHACLCEIRLNLLHR